MRLRSLIPPGLAAVVLATACGGDSVGPPDALEPLTAGPLTGTVGAPLPVPIRLRAVDAQGKAVPGTVVTFSVTQGGGRVDVGGTAVPSIVDTTDGNGEAAVTWTLGTDAAQSHVLTASANGVNPTLFTATAVAGPAAGVLTDESSAFVAPAGGPTDEPLVVLVVDAYDNPVSGAAVSWSALSLGAAVAATSSVSGTDGRASVGATIGAAQDIYLFQASLGSAVDTMAVLGVFTVADPAGDAVATGNPSFATHDVTRLGAAVVDSVLFLYAYFAGPIGPSGGTPTRQSLIGYWDLDLDGDTLTGYYPLRQCLGGTPLNFGGDAFVDLNEDSPYLASVPNPPPGFVPVLRVDSLEGTDRCASSFTGVLTLTPALYAAQAVTVLIPLDFLEDDGAVDMTTLFGHPGTGTVTDVAPDSLAWAFPPTVAAALRAQGRSLTGLEYLAAPQAALRRVRVEVLPPRRWPGR